jgi:hypothetical protein
LGNLGQLIATMGVDTKPLESGLVRVEILLKDFVSKANTYYNTMPMKLDTVKMKQDLDQTENLFQKFADRVGNRIMFLGAQAIAMFAIYKTFGGIKDIARRVSSRRVSEST